MTRITRAALIQASNDTPGEASIDEIKSAMIDKHVALIEQAAEQGAQVTCLQEIFYGPYFCAEQDTRWYESAEPIPDGPTVQLMQTLAKKHKMILVVPIYELDMTGVYYNTAAVIDEHGEYLGKYRKHHIPHCNPGFWEKFYFKPGNLGYPVFETSAGKIGVYICYDRHFPEGARELGLNGAVASTSRHILRELEWQSFPEFDRFRPSEDIIRTNTPGNRRLDPPSLTGCLPPLPPAAPAPSAGVAAPAAPASLVAPDLPGQVARPRRILPRTFSGRWDSSSSE